MYRFFILYHLMILILPSCSLYQTKEERPKNHSYQSCLENFSSSTPLQGWASWYGRKFHGKRTANGERYNMHALTAAHRSLPFGTKVKVTNLCLDKSVIVTINDRGPYVDGRIIDVSYSAARALGMLVVGTAPVEILLLPD